MISNDEEIKRLRAQLQAAKAEIARRNEEIAKRDKHDWQKSLGALCSHYPVLKNRTITSAHYSKNHQHARIKECLKVDHVEVFDQIQSKCLPDFWKTQFSVQPVKELGESCDSESAAQARVVQLLEAVIRGLNLSDVIEVVQNRMLAGIESDVLLAKKPNRLPCAIVEVKKPGFKEEVFLGNQQTNAKQATQGQRQTRAAATSQGVDKSSKRNLVAGQVLDECHAVKMFGFSQVYGMLTDWNNWRLSCTEEISNNDALVAMVMALYDTKNESTRNENQEPSPPPPKIDFAEQLPEEEVLTSGTKRKHQTAVSLNHCCLDKDRTLFCTKVVPDSDEMSEAGRQIVSFVALFVLRAFLSVRNLNHPDVRIEVNKRLPCRILNKADTDTFAFGSVKIASLKYQQFPRSDVKRLYVVHPLGYGAFGECCIAVTENGCVCVVKFFRSPSDGNSSENCAESEMNNWNEVYERKAVPKCFTMDGPEGPYLVMPFLKPVALEDRKKLLEECKIKTALESFASSGYIHDDVRWRHFGWWGEDLLMLDLGGVTKEPDESRVRCWIDRSLCILQERIGTVC